MLSTRFRGAGFSLIEALIVLAIMGIIAAFAVPQYQAQVTKTKRSDGMQMLMSMSARVPKKYTDAHAAGTRASTTVSMMEGTDSRSRICGDTDR